MKAKVSLLKQEGEIEVTSAEAEGFKRLVPGFIRDSFGILDDKIAFERWKKREEIRYLKNVYHKLKTQKLPLQTIPIKIFKPLLDNAVLEENKYLRTKWENLLANAATGKTEVKINFITILNELTSIEATILDDYFQPYLSQEKQEKTEVYFTADHIEEKYNVTTYETRLILENLVRLGILKASTVIEESKHVRSPLYNFKSDFDPSGRRYVFTILGHAFTHACQPPTIGK